MSPDFIEGNTVGVFSTHYVSLISILAPKIMVTLFWFQLMYHWKWSWFWENWGSRNCVLKMNGLNTSLFSLWKKCIDLRLFSKCLVVPFFRSLRSNNMNFEILTSKIFSWLWKVSSYPRKSKTDNKRFQSSTIDFCPRSARKETNVRVAKSLLS